MKEKFSYTLIISKLYIGIHRFMDLYGCCSVISRKKKLKTLEPSSSDKRKENYRLSSIEAIIDKTQDLTAVDTSNG